MTLVPACLVVGDTVPPIFGQHMESKTLLEYTDTVLFQLAESDKLKSANSTFKNDTFPVIANNVRQPSTFNALDTPTTATTKREMFGEGINIPMSFGGGEMSISPRKHNFVT